MVSASTVSTALFTAFCSDLHLGHLAGRDKFDVFPNGISIGYDVDTFRRLTAVSALFKKSEVEASPDALTLTLQDFLDANNASAQQTVENFRTQDVPIAVGFCISAARNLLWDWFEQQNEPAPAITMASIEVAARFGPGRSVGLRDKPSCYYFKVGDSQATATSEFVRSWYEASVLYNPVCEAAEMARQARHGRAEVGIAGHLTFVPKKYSRKRIVVTEPSLNTFFQLGLGEEIARVLRRHTGIDFSTQPQQNSALAKEGSATGRYGTMDLKQCSDYISLALIEYMFPPSLVRWVRTLRTGEVRLSGSKEVIPLAMASTMGNGFTFPLMTTLLTAIVHGVYSTLDIPVRRPPSDGCGANYGVFGDDIIVVSKAFDLVAEVLGYLGLKINLDKSFNHGRFRESCGTDWLDGVDVRPVSLTSYVSEHDLISCFNRLAIWASKYQYNISATLGVLANLIPAALLGPVPPDQADTAGIKLPYPIESPTRVENWVCLWEFTVLTPCLENINFEPWESYSIGIEPESERDVRKLKKWLAQLRSICSGSINEPALLKALLQGGVRRGKTIPRLDKVRFRRVSRVSPRWGYDDGMLSGTLDDSQRLWWQLLVTTTLRLASR